MEVRFEKEISSEFMIIDQQADRTVADYEAQMLHNNHLPGFLDFKMNMADMQVCYYYNIRGLKKLTDYPHLIDDRLAVALMCHIRDIMGVLEDYLLCFDSVCLDENYIFLNPADEFLFAYIPGYCRPAAEQIKNLLAWLMKHIDYHDKDCVARVFNFYRRAENGEDIFEGLPVEPVRRADICNPYTLRYSAETLAPSSAVPENAGGISKAADSISKPVDSISKPAGDISESAVYSWAPERRKTKAGVRNESRTSETENKRHIRKLEYSDDDKEVYEEKGSLLPMILICVACTAAAAVFGGSLSIWLRDLTGIYPMPWLWPVVIAVLSIFICIVIRVCRSRDSDTGDDFWEDDRQMDFVSMKADETTVLAKADEYPQTQLLDHGCLILTGQSEECHETVRVDHFPFTVGKSRAAVQYVLAVPTVSRRHVQIQYTDGLYYVTDLYSTNGTKINGRSLSPGKAYKIENGDSLQIAGIAFDVRCDADKTVAAPF